MGNREIFFDTEIDRLLQDKILSYARDVLTSSFCELATDNPASDVQGSELRTVVAVDRLNVTIRYEGKIRGSMSAPGSSLGEQIEHAVMRALNDNRFAGPLTRSEFQRSTIEIWIQIKSADIVIADRPNKNCLQMGTEGIELELDGKAAYYKPSVAITGGFSTPQRMFSALCKKAGLHEDAWNDPKASLRKTTWIGLIRHDKTDSPERLRALRHEEAEQITPDSLRRWLGHACCYMHANQTADGGIAYIYRPFRNEIDRESLNLVRAGGCLYSLSLATGVQYPGSQANVALDTAHALAQFLFRRSVSWRENGLVVAEQRGEKLPKLGAAALVAAALSAPQLRRFYPEQADRFLFAIQSAQKDDGRFVTHFGTDEEQESSVNFFPGQALIALALNIEDPSNHDRCERAFIPYRTHFRAAPTTAFVGWQVDVWARLASASNRPDWASFAFEQTDWLLQMQVTDSPLVDWNGGFSRTGDAPAFSSIVFVEALLRALKLADVFGDIQRLKTYRRAALLGLQFCERLRLDALPSSFFPDPGRARGGIAMGLNNKNVRCDVVQHFITMCLAALDVESLLFD